MNDWPDRFKVHEGREKPWGTRHAIYAARNVINGPFAMINGDDYYLACQKFKSQDYQLVLKKINLNHR